MADDLTQNLADLALREPQLSGGEKEGEDLGGQGPQQLSDNNAAVEKGLGKSSRQLEGEDLGGQSSQLLPSKNKAPEEKVKSSHDLSADRGIKEISAARLSKVADTATTRGKAFADAESALKAIQGLPENNDRNEELHKVFKKTIKIEEKIGTCTFTIMPSDLPMKTVLEAVARHGLETVETDGKLVHKRTSFVLNLMGHDFEISVSNPKTCNHQLSVKNLSDTKNQTKQRKQNMSTYEETFDALLSTGEPFVTREVANGFLDLLDSPYEKWQVMKDEETKYPMLADEKLQKTIDFLLTTMVAEDYRTLQLGNLTEENYDKKHFKFRTPGTAKYVRGLLDSISVGENPKVDFIEFKKQAVFTQKGGTPAFTKAVAMGAASKEDLEDKGISCEHEFDHRKGLRRLSAFMLPDIIDEAEAEPQESLGDLHQQKPNNCPEIGDNRETPALE